MKKKKTVTKAIAAVLAFSCAVQTSAAASPSDEKIRKLAGRHESGILAIGDKSAAGKKSLRGAGKVPKISKKKMTLTIGEKAALKVKGAQRKAKWKSSNKKVAAVSAKGVVKAKKAGKAKITAKVGKKKLFCKVTVKRELFIASNKILSIDVDESEELKIAYGGKGDLYFKNSDNDVCFCEWENGWDGDVATLDVYGMDQGFSRIAVTNSEDDRKLVINVTVTDPENELSEKEMLMEYIQKYGRKDSDGDKYIFWNFHDKDTPGKYHFEIGYEALWDAFDFTVEIYFDNVQYFIEMELPFEDSSDSVPIMALSETDSEEYIGEADILPEDYDDDEGASFSVEDCPKSLKKTISELFKNAFSLGMIGWASMLKSRIGISMVDIGFSSYSY